MLASCHLSAWAFDRSNQIELKHRNTRGRCHPTLYHRRLDNDDLNFLNILKHPRSFRRTHGGSGVKHPLVVLSRLDSHAIAKLPIQHNCLLTDPAK